MSFPFLLFRPFDLFRTPPLGQSSAPRVTINALGEATITCRPRPGPRVSMDADGLATITCMPAEVVVDTNIYFMTADNEYFTTIDGEYFVVQPEDPE